jgi:hypothetical protein
MTQPSTSDLSRVDTRKAGRLETMPDDLFEEFKQAVDAYEQESDETGAEIRSAPDA